MKTRLRNHTSAQCYVIKGDVLQFISYTTLVIRMYWEKGQRYIECTGTYSATTRRQIGWFLKEYASDLTYYDIKEIAGKGAVAI